MKPGKGLGKEMIRKPGMQENNQRIRKP